MKKSLPDWVQQLNGLNKTYTRPIIPLLLGLISGIVFGYVFSPYKIGFYFLFLISSLGIIFSVIKNKNACISPIILFLTLGYFSIQPWVAPRFSTHHIIHYTNSHARKIIGTVASPPIESKNHTRFVLNTEAIGQHIASVGVKGKISVSIWGNIPRLRIGDRVSFFSSIKPIRNFNNPGGFDYKRYMHFNKIWGTAHTPAKKLIVLNSGLGNDTNGMIANARLRISDLIDNTFEGEQQGILKALIVGNRQDISPTVREAFNRAGVGHLLAISGLHIGIIATVAFVFFRWLLSHSQALLWRAWTRKGAAMLSLLPVLIYGLLAGMSPSTQRAVIMVAVFLITFLLEREQDLINTLAMAALLILIWHPPSLFSISFQLSFIAVVSIVSGLSILPERLSRLKSRFRILNKLPTFLWVSFFAILGTMPLVMLYFNQVSLVGLIANILLIPMVGFIVVPLGLIAVFVIPISVDGALWVLNISSVALAQALKFIDYFAQLPFASIKTITPSCFEIACFYIGFWSLVNLKSELPKIDENEIVGLNTGRQSDPLKPLFTKWIRVHTSKNTFGKVVQKFWERCAYALTPAGIVLVIIMLAVVADVGYWMYYRCWHKDLRITAIDVGHGSASLLELPYGYNLLIDGGGFSENSTFDVGARIIAPLLWQKKIKTIDTLILSHPDSDHLNGLLYIAEHFNVKQIWTNSQESKAESYRKFIDIIIKKAIPAPKFRNLIRTHHINGVTLNIFYPPDDFPEKQKQEKWRNYNNNSMVVQIEIGTRKFLFPGDITAQAEAELVEINGKALKSTVLFAPHHGSSKSNSDIFLEHVNPESVVISTGWKNRFNFPHPLVLRKYQKRRYHIYRTDLLGAITLTTDGENLTVRPFLD